MTHLSHAQKAKPIVTGADLDIFLGNFGSAIATNIFMEGLVYRRLFGSLVRNLVVNAAERFADLVRIQALMNHCDIKTLSSILFEQKMAIPNFFSYSEFDSAKTNAVTTLRKKGSSQTCI